MLKNKTLSSRFLIASMLVLFALIALLIYRPLTQFFSYDSLPKRVLTNENKEGEYIYTSAYIAHFMKSEIGKSRAFLELYVTFTYDSTKINSDIIDGFYVEQAVVKGKERIESKVLENGMHRVTYRLFVNVNFISNYSLFPLNDHALSIVISVPMESYVLKIDHNDFSVGDGTFIPGWKINDTYAYVCSSVNQKKLKSDVKSIACVFEVKNTGHATLMTLFIPLLILFAIAVFSFGFEQKTAVGIVVRNMLSCLAFRFVIDNFALRVSYITFADSLFIFVLTANVIIFFLHMIYKHVTQRTKYISVVVLQAVLLFMICMYVKVWY